MTSAVDQSYSAWGKLRSWAPVVGVMVAVLTLAVALAILVAGALSRMESRLRSDMAVIREEVVQVRSEVQALNERVARIEGALAGGSLPAFAEGAADSGAGVEP